MILLPFSHPLAVLLRRKATEWASLPDPGAHVRAERLPASRPVFRFSLGEGPWSWVGKFFTTFPPATAPDRALLLECRHYQEAPEWAGEVGGFLPRFRGRAPDLRLGLLLDAVEGPDLDVFLGRARDPGGQEALLLRLRRLAGLLARFHARPVPPLPVTAAPGLLYLEKIGGQLEAAGLLSLRDRARLAAETEAWPARFSAFADHQVVLHGDATPTNFLFPDGQVVALDLERLRLGDRLFDLAWVAGELKHSWGWRFQDFAGAEPAIGAFFAAYLEACPGHAGAAERLFALNPFYMALAELRIARNAYLPWEYRRRLVAEALNCLAWGRKAL